jgi:hypothetical protein
MVTKEEKINIILKDWCYEKDTKKVLADRVWKEAQKELLNHLGFALDKINADKKAWFKVKDWRDEYLNSLR